MTTAIELHLFHEVVPQTLSALLHHINGEKAEMAVGGLGTVLGLLMEVRIPSESIPDIIKACESVRNTIGPIAEQYKGILEIVETTIENLMRRMNKKGDL